MFQLLPLKLALVAIAIELNMSVPPGTVSTQALPMVTCSHNTKLPECASSHQSYEALHGRGISAKGAGARPAGKNTCSQGHHNPSNWALLHQQLAEVRSHLRDMEFGELANGVRSTPGLS
jgi:hypothetical protein